MNTSLEHLKMKIKNKMDHTYLNKFINRPVIDDEKLSILSTIVNNSDLPLYKKEQYIVTTMLVQIALDTHDLVPITNENETTNRNMTTKQLTVLAGDYFSGLYYFLLAEIKDITMIQVLASTIKEINEYKMQLYYHEFYSFQDYISVVKKVDSLLIVKVAAFLNENELSELAEEILIRNRLIEERSNIYAKKQVPIIDYWLSHHDEQSVGQILQKIDIMTEQKTTDLRKKVSEEPGQYSFYNNQVKGVFKDLIYSNITPVVEEG